MNKQKIIDRHSKCDDCENSQVYSSGRFAFLGCTHKPYHGKWVVELEECPKDGEKFEDE